MLILINFFQVFLSTFSKYYQLSHKGGPRTQEWIAYPFSSGSSRPRNWTGVSCIAGRFFTNWAIREAQILILVNFFTFFYVFFTGYCSTSISWYTYFFYSEERCKEDGEKEIRSFRLESRISVVSGTWSKPLQKKKKKKSPHLHLHQQS